MQGKSINGFTLQRRLGEGGMAEVWYAENEIGKAAAVKILNESLSHNEQIVERFHNEALVMVKLEHPNIRQVYGYGYIDNRHCIVMEYLEGDDLDALLKAGRKFTDEELQRWWNQTVDALNYTHAMGIVHRDIKPSNLFLDKNGNIKLLDFGIAKVKESISMTRTGALMGTLMYMSPEQVRDTKNIDYRTDVYSLAVSFAQLVSGSRPYDCEKSDDFEIREQIVYKPLDLKGLPPAWQGFLAPYLEKDPQKRPALRHFEPVMPKEEPAKTVVDKAKATVVEEVRQPEPKPVANPAPKSKPKEPQPTAKPQPKQEEPKALTHEPSEKPKSKKGLWIGLGAAAVVLVAVLVVVLTRPKGIDNDLNYEPEKVELPYKLNYYVQDMGDKVFKIKDRNIMDVLLDDEGNVLVDGIPTDISVLKDTIYKFMTPRPADETAPHIYVEQIEPIGDIMRSLGVVRFSSRSYNYDNASKRAEVVNEIAKAFAEMRLLVSKQRYGRNLDMLDQEAFNAIQKATPVRVVGLGEYVGYNLQIVANDEEEDNIGDINNTLVEVCMNKEDDNQGIISVMDDFYNKTKKYAVRVCDAEKTDDTNGAEETAYKDCTTIQSCEAYLKAYPNGKYAKQVKAKKAELENKEKKQSKEIQSKEDIVINAEVEQNEVIEEYFAPEVVEEVVVEEEIFQIVEEMPQFPGGDAKMMDYVAKNLKYPQIARETGIQGRVFVGFVIEPDGSISNVKLLRGIGGGCDEEAIRIVKSFPKWKPGKQRGKAVRVSYQLPVFFKLQ